MHALSPLAPILLLTGLGMIAVGLGSVVGWQVRTRAAWAYVGIGAVAWLVGVALKFAWAVPTNGAVHAMLTQTFGATVGPALGWLYTGLLTGIFECGSTWVFVRATRVRDADDQQAIAFGIGFGAVEALILGVFSFLATAGLLLAFDKISPVERAQVTSALGQLWLVPLPVVERACAVVLHMVASVFVVWSVRRRKMGWFALAFAHKTFVDGFAAWAIERFQITHSMARYAEFCTILAATSVLSLLALSYLRRRASRSTAPPRETAAVSA